MTFISIKHVCNIVISLIITSMTSQASIYDLNYNPYEQDSSAPIPWEVSFTPHNVASINIGHDITVNMNFTISNRYFLKYKTKGDSTAKQMQEHVTNRTFVANVISENGLLAIPLNTDLESKPFLNDTKSLLLEVAFDQITSFAVKGKRLGTTSLQVNIYGFPANYSFALTDWEYIWLNTKTLKSSILLEDFYRVNLVRRFRYVDMAFNCVMAAIATINAFSMGCVTKYTYITAQIKTPKSLIIGLTCQIILMPLIAFIIMCLIPIPSDESLGLLYIACTPGGGLGHIIVALIEGDNALSITMNLFSTLASIGTTPLWIFVFGRSKFSKLNPDVLHKIVNVEIWLSSSIGAYIIGTILNHFHPKSSEALLNWFVKPLLLFFTLIFTTLGGYINIYMFSITSYLIPLAAGLLPFTGFMTAAIISHISKQDKDLKKVIITETTFCNGILVLVIIRFSLAQPHADLASVMPIWAMYFSPLPFITTGLVRCIRRYIKYQCQKRKEQKYRTFSIVSSLMNVTNITTISSMTSRSLRSPASDDEQNEDDDDASDVLIDEKITVL